MKNKASFFLLLISLFNISLFSQEDDKVIKISEERLPVLSTINAKDPVFKEYSFIVADNYKLIAQQKDPDLVFFKYKVEEKVDLLSLAARCNIRYETIATLNGLENSHDSITGKTLLLPTAPGLFVKKYNGNTSLEILLREHYLNEDFDENALTYRINGNDYLFLANQKLAPTERTYFLDDGLRLPLDKDSFYISSKFGRRKNPFSGNWRNHNGIDLAAVVGTPIYAIKDGAVSLKEMGNTTFGNYVIISHDRGKMTSVYAHMSTVLVEQYDYVKKGQIIGYVGDTGMVTGPHLHFEIRQGGVPQDPEKKLKLE